MGFIHHFHVYHPTLDYVVRTSDSAVFCSSIHMLTKIPGPTFERRRRVSSPNKKSNTNHTGTQTLNFSSRLRVGQDSTLEISHETGLILTKHRISMSCPRSPYPRRFMNFCTNSQLAALLAGLFPRLKSSLSSFTG